VDDKIESRFHRAKKPAPPEVAGFFQRFEFEKGIEYLDGLLEKEPDFEDAWVKKGDLCQLVQRYGDAVQAYDRALAINPANEAAWHGKEASTKWVKR
jgi:tetratricopeptide (TPR) repeat protein